jgi:hypothetical protein
MSSRSTPPSGPSQRTIDDELALIRKIDELIEKRAKDSSIPKVAAHKRRKATQTQKKQYHAPDAGALLYTRQQSRRALSCSLAKILRLEAAGKLDKLRLDPKSENSIVYHRAAQVKALAGVR